MIIGALIGIAVYLTISALRARARVVAWERFWTPERRALRALALSAHQEQQDSA